MVFNLMIPSRRPQMASSYRLTDSRAKSYLLLWDGVRTKLLSKRCTSILCFNLLLHPTYRVCRQPHGTLPRGGAGGERFIRGRLTKPVGPRPDAAGHHGLSAPLPPLPPPPSPSPPPLPSAGAALALSPTVCILLFALPIASFFLLMASFFSPSEWTLKAAAVGPLRPSGRRAER